MTIEQRILIFIYIGICILDYAIAPWLWVLVQSGDVIQQWQPITSGAFHSGFIGLMALTKIETISSMFAQIWNKLSAAQATILVALITGAFTSPIILEYAKTIWGER